MIKDLAPSESDKCKWSSVIALPCTHHRITWDEPNSGPWLCIIMNPNPLIGPSLIVVSADPTQWPPSQCDGSSRILGVIGYMYLVFLFSMSLYFLLPEYLISDQEALWTLASYTWRTSQVSEGLSCGSSGDKLSVLFVVFYLEP